MLERLLKKQGIVDAKRSISISINDVCPLRCEHCAIGYSDENPGSKAKVAAEDLRGFVLGVDRDVYDMVSFVGGEPSLAPSLLKVGFETCYEVGLGRSVTTAPIWAQTRESARRFVTQFRHAFVVNLSYDAHHLNFLSVQHYVNAIEVAHELHCPVVLTFCFSDESEKPRLLGSLWRVLPLVTNVSLLRIVPIGAAAKPEFSLAHPTDTVRVDSQADLERIHRTCLVGDSHVTRTLKVHACCFSSAIDDSPLCFGPDESRGETLADALAKMERSPTFQMLRRDGFIDSMSADSKAEAARLVRDRSYVSECELCLELMTKENRRFWNERIQRHSA